MNRFLLIVVSLGCLLIGSCENHSACMDNIIFPDPQTSEYVLPYPVGSTAKIFQSYCNRDGHRGRLAYDFSLLLGAPITASRAGIVQAIENNFEDNDHTPGHNNRVVIRHSDSTLAWYAHLQRHSVTVDLKDNVIAGDTLGFCGLSGRSGAVPHLHFEVFNRQLYNYSDAIPISFRNVEGIVDSSGMLIVGASYMAGPF